MSRRLEKAIKEIGEQQNRIISSAIDVLKLNELEHEIAEKKAKLIRLEQKIVEVSEINPDEVLAEIARLDSLRAEYEALVPRLEAQLAEYAKENAELKAKKLELETEIARLDSLRAELEALVTKLETQLAESAKENAELKAQLGIENQPENEGE